MASDRDKSNVWGRRFSSAKAGGLRWGGVQRERGPDESAGSEAQRNRC